MSACILYLRPFLDALTSGFINGDDLRRRGAIRPYTFVSNKAASSFALKERKGGSDLYRSSESQGQATEAMSVSERDQHILPEISPVSSLQDIGRMTLAMEERV